MQDWWINSCCKAGGIVGRNPIKYLDKSKRKQEKKKKVDGSGYNIARRRERTRGNRRESRKSFFLRLLFPNSGIDLALCLVEK